MGNISDITVGDTTSDVIRWTTVSLPMYWALDGQDCNVNGSCCGGAKHHCGQWTMDGQGCDVNALESQCTCQKHREYSTADI